MSTNIEIKAVYPNLQKARLIAISLGAKASLAQQQRDTYFAVRNGRLKLREIPGISWLIPYVRPDEMEAKRSNYEVIVIDSPDHTRALLSEILGVSVVVEKQREIFLLDNIRIHLDDVTDLGRFVEFEAVCDPMDQSAEETNKAKIQQLIIDFEIDSKALVKESYHELLLVGAKTLSAAGR